jgi:hypothetical protein
MTMSGTSRTVLQRQRRREFTDETLAIWAEMRQLSCTCGALDLTGLRDTTECANCKRWEVLHTALWRSLPRHPPWLYPLVPRRDDGTRDGWRLRDELEAALAEAEGR